MDVTRAAVLAELAAVRWSPIAGAIGAAAVLAALDLAVWPGGPLALLAWLSAAMLGGAAALTLDEPRHDPSLAVPTSRRLRTAARLLLPMLAFGAWLAYAGGVTAAIRREGGTVSWAALAVVGIAAVVAAASAAAVLRRAGHAEPGGVVASSAVAIALGLTLVPLPGRLHPYDVSALNGSSVLWVAVAGLSLAGLWWSTRDAWTTAAIPRPHSVVTPTRHRRDAEPADPIWSRSAHIRPPLSSARQGSEHRCLPHEPVNDWSESR